MWPKFPDICLIVEEKPRKKLNQEIDPTGDRTQARCVRGNDVTPRPQRCSRPLRRPALRWKSQALEDLAKLGGTNDLACGRQK